MWKNWCLVLSSWFLVAMLSGCVVRTYPVTRDRVDQDLGVGNRGYLKGEVKEGDKDRKATRTVQIVEIELHPPIKFEKMPKEDYIKKEEYIERVPAPQEEPQDRDIWGNRGYISGSAPEKSMEAVSMPVANLEKYRVEKGDTLQKISKKFYGTTKRWKKIYEANADKLKAPDKIYPGQIIDIPLEPLRETKENLK